MGKLYLKVKKTIDYTCEVCCQDIRQFKSLSINGQYIVFLKDGKGLLCLPMKPQNCQQRCRDLYQLYSPTKNFTKRKELLSSTQSKAQKNSNRGWKVGSQDKEHYLISGFLECLGCLCPCFNCDFTFRKFSKSPATNEDPSLWQVYTDSPENSLLLQLVDTRVL